MSALPIENRGLMLDGLRMERLYTIFMGAFSVETDLELLARFDLDQNFQIIVPGNAPLGTKIWSLLTWAERNGRMEDLIRGACKMREHIKALHDFAEEVGVDLQAVDGRDSSVLVEWKLIRRHAEGLLMSLNTLRMIYYVHNELTDEAALHLKEAWTILCEARLRRLASICSAMKRVDHEVVAALAEMVITKPILIESISSGNLRELEAAIFRLVSALIDVLIEADSHIHT